MLEFKNRDLNEPPKNKTFLVVTIYGYKLSKWDGNEYIEICPCDCYESGFTCDFQFWADLPLNPLNIKNDT